MTRNVYDCPSGSSRFGIGINLYTSLSGGNATLEEVAQPARTIYFADSQLISNPTEPNPILWQSTATDVIHFPPNPADSLYLTHPASLMNKHTDKANIVFVDGHVEPLRNDQFGHALPIGDTNNLWDTK